MWGSVLVLALAATVAGCGDSPGESQAGRPSRTRQRLEREGALPAGVAVALRSAAVEIGDNGQATATFVVERLPTTLDGTDWSTLDLTMVLQDGRKPDHQLPTVLVSANLRAAAGWRGSVEPRVSIAGDPPGEFFSADVTGNTVRFSFPARMLAPVAESLFLLSARVQAGPPGQALIDIDELS